MKKLIKTVVTLGVLSSSLVASNSIKAMKGTW